MIEITSSPVSVQPVIDHVRQNHHGCLVNFVGTVRDHSEGKQVIYLEYETYRKMAENKLHEIIRTIKQRWAADCAVVHRIGRVEVGDTVVVIVVGAGHRAEAFVACQYAIDRIKEIVPIWKKEYYTDGSSWIGHPPTP